MCYLNVPIASNLLLHVCRWLRTDYLKLRTLLFGVMNVKFSINIEFSVLLENIILENFQSISLSALYYRLNDIS